jgi:hypothetical protein
VSVDADMDSAQWERAKALLDKFPGKDRLVRQFDEALRKKQLDWGRDIEPAIGGELAFASFAPGLDGDHVVGLTKPDDVGKLRALTKKLDGGPSTVERIGDWVVFSNDASLVQRLRGSGGSLADDDAFQSALRQLPEERLGVVWSRGRALGGLTPTIDWVAAAVSARDNGAALTFVASSTAKTGKPYVSKRVDEAPADALVFASFSTDSLNAQAVQLEPFGSIFGIRIGDLLRELRGEGALWIRPGDGLVQLTVVVGARDASRALARLRRVLPEQLHAGVVGGNIVVTTSASVKRALAVSGPRLGDSPEFAAAVEAAGMPDKTSGFLFVNVARALPLLTLAGMGGKLPPDAVANLRPLRSVVAWAQPEGQHRSRFEVFAQIQ